LHHPYQELKRCLPGSLKFHYQIQGFVRFEFLRVKISGPENQQFFGDFDYFGTHPEHPHEKITEKWLVLPSKKTPKQD